MSSALASYSRSLIFAGKILLTGLIVAYIFFQFHPAQLYEALLRGDRIMLFVSAALLIPNLFMQFLKWKFLVSFLKPDASNAEVAGSLFAGFTAGLMTPARIGECLGRGYYLRGIQTMSAVGLTLLDKFALLLVTIIAGMIGLMYVLTSFHYISAYFWLPFVLLLAFFIALSIWCILHPPFVWRFIDSLPQGGTSHRRLRVLFESFQSLTTRQILYVLALSVLFYFVFLAQYLFAISAFGSMNLIHLASAVALALFAKTLIPPITFGELGIREGALVYFLSFFGGSAVGAVNASLFVFTCNILLPSCIGLFFLPRISIDHSQHSA